MNALAFPGFAPDPAQAASIRLRVLSLRVGLATSAAMAEISTLSFRRTTGHASDAMLARYVRTGDIFTDNAAASVLEPRNVRMITTPERLQWGGFLTGHFWHGDG